MGLKLSLKLLLFKLVLTVFVGLMTLLESEVGFFLALLTAAFVLVAGGIDEEGSREACSAFRCSIKKSDQWEK